MRKSYQTNARKSPRSRSFVYVDGMKRVVDTSTKQTHLPLMTTKDVAEYLNVPVGTLYKWRRDGVAPASFRVGRGARYRREDVDAWLRERAT